MQDWRRKKGLMRAPRYHTVFDPMEREVLGNLASTLGEALMERVRSAPKDELAEMTGMPSGHREPPQDPGLARLLPNFAREGDEEFDGDNQLLRSLHENDITRAKLENLQAVTAALGPDGGVDVTLDESEARAWIAALNDIRLYVAAGNGLAGSGLAGTEVVPGEAATVEAERLVEWLAYNQESLLTALTGE
ncbi:DUF2017 domain-containing protein [Corynebacterium frankenforstense]